MKPAKGKVEFSCDDLRLERGFYWAKAMALSYVNEGTPAGDWYEAALPGRNAFCMRDVAHQATGAQVLGLARHNLNMLGQFARSVQPSRDYCGYWEINGDGKPAPIDYTDDSDFWYNLPANFDVLDACWRMYLWTDEPDYLHDADFNRFYDWTVNQYVETWDRNGDGVPERQQPGSRRGLASYDEGPGLDDALMLSDLLATQAAAYEAYGHLHREKYNRNRTAVFQARATELRQRFENGWWDPAQQRFFNVLLRDGRFQYSEGSNPGHLPLYYRLLANPERIARHLELLGATDPQVETLAYIPEVFYAYGRPDKAREYLLKLTDPGLGRREYPEVGFSVVGAVASGLMGVQPVAYQRTVRTLAQLPTGLHRAALDHLPVFDGEIQLEHTQSPGGSKSCLTNLVGTDLRWQAGFWGENLEVLCDGRKLETTAERRWDGRAVTWAEVRLPLGHTAQLTARVKK
ncbi:MAG: hypothetical protein WCG80_09375 [Spirochaetales bacterium]